MSGAREDSTDGFHLPGLCRRDRRRTVEGPCSVSRPNGENEREGEQGRGEIQTIMRIDSTYPTGANTSGESVEDPRIVDSEGTWA